MGGVPEIPGWHVWSTTAPDLPARLHARMEHVAPSSSPWLEADGEDELRKKIEAAERDNPLLAKLNRSGG